MREGGEWVWEINSLNGAVSKTGLEGIDERSKRGRDEG